MAESFAPPLQPTRVEVCGSRFPLQLALAARGLLDAPLSGQSALMRFLGTAEWLVRTASSPTKALSLLLRELVQRAQAQPAVCQCMIVLVLLPLLLLSAPALVPLVCAFCIALKAGFMVARNALAGVEVLVDIACLVCARICRTSPQAACLLCANV